MSRGTNKDQKVNVIAFTTAQFDEIDRQNELHYWRKSLAYWQSSTRKNGSSPTRIRQMQRAHSFIRVFGGMTDAKSAPRTKQGSSKSAAN